MGREYNGIAADEGRRGGEDGDKKGQADMRLALGLEVHLGALVDVGVGHGKGTTAAFVCDCPNKFCGIVAVIAPG